VVDLRVGGGRGGVALHEAVPQAAGVAPGEAAGEPGARVGRVEERRLVGRVGTALRAAEEGRARLCGDGARVEDADDVVGCADPARGDAGHLGGRTDRPYQVDRRQATGGVVVTGERATM